MDQVKFWLAVLAPLVYVAPLMVATVSVVLKGGVSDGRHEVAHPQDS